MEYNDIRHKGECVNAISLQRQFSNKEIYSDRLTYDLCPECMKKVIAFMKDGQKNEV